MKITRDLRTRQKIKNFFDIAIYSLLFDTLLSLYVAILSKSASITAFLLDDILCVIVYLFAMATIKLSMKNNIYEFPYGTGRLENFISFLTAALCLPTAFFIAYNTIMTTYHPPAEIRFGYTQIVFIYSIARLIFLKILASKIMKRPDDYSPILRAYDVQYTVWIVITAFSSLSFVLAQVLQKNGLDSWARSIDIIISFSMAIYMLATSVMLMKDNFAALIDLPMKETDQLFIMRVLGKHYERYQNIGHVYTRTSGSIKIVEVELHFPKATALEEISKLQESLRGDLRARFQDLRFHLIPIVSA